MGKYNVHKEDGGTKPDKKGGGSWWEGNEVYTGYAACHEKHTPLELVSATDGKTYEVQGASCFKPRDGFDIYVGLDSGMKYKSSGDPWEGNYVQAINICCHINDMGVPANMPRFKLMITWLCTQLHAGKKIHIGCMGGHGRTGFTLAALVKEFTGNVDAIKFLREQYCPKAVESKKQIEVLVAEYGVKTAEPTKEGWLTKSTSTHGGSGRVETAYEKEQRLTGRVIEGVPEYGHATTREFEFGTSGVTSTTYQRGRYTKKEGQVWDHKLGQYVYPATAGTGAGGGLIKPVASLKTVWGEAVI